MLVYLLRHGDAADLSSHGPHTDEARPLTAEGSAKLAKACSTYARIVITPGRVVSSPLLRAVQTAQIFADAVDFTGTLEQDPILVPGARATAALELLRMESAAGSQAIALVGHEPHMGSLLGLLLTGNERVAIPLRKGMLVGVELESAHTMLCTLRFAIPQGVGKTLRR